MPNIKSAIKRSRTSERRRLHNAAQKSTLRSAIKAVDTAVSNNDTQANELLNEAVKKIDKAAAKGLLHKNAAARTKSRLTKSVNALS